jgi:hypothetical protein
MMTGEECLVPALEAGEYERVSPLQDSGFPMEGLT